MPIKQRNNEVKNYPYGEARRLRYALIICQECSKSNLVDQHIFIKKILFATSTINDKLRNYKGQTGILQTPHVANNYLLFCKWLDIIKIERGFVLPSSLTPFLISLDHTTDFTLSNQEKVGVMMQLLTKDYFTSFLKMIGDENTANDFIKQGIDDHFVESALEWLVDLDILDRHKNKRGYILSETGKNTLYSKRVDLSYYSSILKNNIRAIQSINKFDLYHLLRVSIKILLSDYFQTIDKDYFPIKPLIRYVQVLLIVHLGVYMEFEDLVNQMKTDSKELKTYIFRWNEIFDMGYIKFNDERA